jgi:hypothetical protein
MLAAAVEAAPAAGQPQDSAPRLAGRHPVDGRIGSETPPRE